MAGENNIDPDLIDQTNKGFEQFNRIMEASTAALGASIRAGRSATEEAAKRARAEADLLVEIKKNAAAYGLGSKATKAQIQQVADTIKVEKEADKIRQEIAEAEKKRDKEIEDAVKKLGYELKSLAKNSIGAATAVYTSDKAFSSTIPTLDLVSSAFKAVVEATGVALSGISAFGFSLGNAPQGISKVVSAGITVATEVAKMQLEMAQKYVDTYDQLSAVGVTFGGQLTGLAATAAEGGLNLQTFGNFVKNNAESLSTMGGGMEAAASRVMKMGKAAVEGNDKLLVMYGGFEQVDGALAGFAATIARSGLDTVKNQAAIQASSGAYLFTLKELQEVTGMSLGQVKAAQEEQAKDAAFQLKLLELRSQGEAGIKQANALEFLQIETTRMYGKQAGDLMKEKVALDGKVISSTGLQYMAMNKGISDATDGIIATSKLDEKVRLQAVAQVVKGAESEVEANRKRMTALVKVQTYAPGDQGKVQADQIREEMAGRDARLNLDATANERAKKMAEDTSDTTKKAAELARQQNTVKQTMDQKVEGSMGKMAELATGLMKIQTALIDTFGGKFTDSITKVISGLGDLATELDKFNKNKKLAETSNPAPGTLTGKDLDKEAGKKPGSLERKDGTKYNPYAQNQVGGGAVSTPKSGSPATRSATPAASGTPQTESAPTPGKGDENKGGEGGKAPTPGKGDENKGGDGGKSKAPELAKVTSKSGSSASVGKQYATQFQGIIDWLDTQGYKIKSLGGYNDRDVTGKPGVKSIHAFGGALDINPEENPYNASKLITDMPDGVAKIAQSLGLGWGGNWATPKDAMHFSVAQNEGGTVKLMAKGGVTDGVSIAGEAGPEAVIPLPDGRTVPVKMDTGDLVSKLEEMIKIMRDQHDTSERILIASS